MREKQSVLYQRAPHPGISPHHYAGAESAAHTTDINRPAALHRVAAAPPRPRVNNQGALGTARCTVGPTIDSSHCTIWIWDKKN